MAVWDEFVPQADRELYSAAGFGTRVGLGERPALLVIDVSKSFCGYPATAAGDQMVSAHGEGIDASSAVEHTRSLLASAREAGVPIIYTASTNYRSDGVDAGRWRDKNPRLIRDAIAGIELGGNDIATAVAPQPQDFVIVKPKPSAFFSTMLESLLNTLVVDTLLVCGVTTSGCVRATVIDAFSLNYRVSVVEECTFDRSPIVHAMSLFDMNNKYADVLSVVAVTEYVLKFREDSVNE